MFRAPAGEAVNGADFDEDQRAGEAAGHPGAAFLRPMAQDEGEAHAGREDPESGEDGGGDEDPAV
ncbi:MAG TPA: hypothetical protein VHC72_00645 [Bryobacteraceae bacterium]|nr:hypothetical protein [Bryobacteraceae bacterium]